MHIDNHTENSLPNICAKYFVSPGVQCEEVDKASGNVNNGRYIHILILHLRISTYTHTMQR